MKPSRAEENEEREQQQRRLARGFAVSAFAHGLALIVGTAALTHAGIPGVVSGAESAPVGEAVSVALLPRRQQTAVETVAPSPSIAAASPTTESTLPGPARAQQTKITGATAVAIPEATLRSAVPERTGERPHTAAPPAPPAPAAVLSAPVPVEETRPADPPPETRMEARPQENPSPAASGAAPGEGSGPAGSGSGDGGGNGGLAEGAGEATESLGPPAPPAAPGGTGGGSVPTAAPKGETRGALVVSQITPELPRGFVGEARTLLVRVEVDVAADGSSMVRLALSSGEDAVDRSVLTAMKRWRWRPALQNGNPVASIEKFHFKFEVK